MKRWIAAGILILAMTGCSRYEPAMEMTREMTIAKIGLFIKNLDITFDPPIWTVRHRLKG